MTTASRPVSVGVVLPVHDGARHLRRAAESVLDQDHADLELVIVDDGSRDASPALARDLAREDARVIVVELGRNRGVAAARNAGAGASHAGLLAFIDQDDIWTRDRLSRGVEALAAEPALGYVTARQRFLPAEGPIPSWVRPELLDGDIPGNVLGTVLCRRTVWDGLGGLEPSLRRGFDDVDWFARARRAGIGTRELPVVLLLRGLHGGNASARVDRVREELLTVVRRHLQDRGRGR